MKNTEYKAQFNFKDRIDLAENTPLLSPLVVYVEPSSFCNLECRFCPQHSGKGLFPKHNMELNTFKKILEDLKTFEKKPNLMRFCGIGDPLFNKSTPLFVELVKSSNLVERTELITNGILLNDDAINSLAVNLDRIIFSIEGLNVADYKEFTLRNIDFDKFITKISKMYHTAGRTCTIHIKIHNQAVLTVDQKNKFFQIFSDICDEIYIENLVDLWPEKESNLGLNSGHRFVNKPIKTSLVCPQIFKSLQVNADGRVLPCCVDWQSLNIVGDIKKNSLIEIWNDDPLKNLQIRHLNGERYKFSPCRGCSHNEYSEEDNLDDNKSIILNKILNHGK